jgi:hypothetical protein
MAWTHKWAMAPATLICKTCNLSYGMTKDKTDKNEDDLSRFVQQDLAPLFKRTGKYPYVILGRRQKQWETPNQPNSESWRTGFPLTLQDPCCLEINTTLHSTLRTADRARTADWLRQRIVTCALQLASAISCPLPCLSPAGTHGGCLGTIRWAIRCGVANSLPPDISLPRDL